MISRGSFASPQPALQHRALATGLSTSTPVERPPVGIPVTCVWSWGCPHRTHVAPMGSSPSVGPAPQQKPWNMCRDTALCAHVCVHGCACVCVHVHACVHRCACVCAHGCACVCMHVCTGAHVCVHTGVRACARAQVGIVFGTFPHVPHVRGERRVFRTRWWSAVSARASHGTRELAGPGCEGDQIRN